MAEATPMMRQFLEIKQANPGCLLMFRLGDFYEMFDEDARIASRELDLTLTTRDKGKDKDQQTPMCGVPYMAVEPYIARLVAKGHKVAICEQMEDPSKVKGLVKREIVRVVSPGSVTDSSMLNPDRNNYFASIYGQGGVFALFVCDISTGLFSGTVADTPERLMDEVGRFRPREVLMRGDAMGNAYIESALREQLPCNIDYGADRLYLFEDYNCRKVLMEQFGTLPENFPEAALIAAGALVQLLRSYCRNHLPGVREMDLYPIGKYMDVDLAARRSLELTQNMRSGDKQGSLLWVLDKAKTPMGSRLLRSWIEKPLLDTRAIAKRLDAVEELVQNTVAREELILLLREVTDLERVMGRIVNGNCSARDLRQLANGAVPLPQIRGQLSALQAGLWQTLTENLDTLEDIRAEIDRTIVTEPPMTVREGGMIAPGCNEELDRLRDIMSGGKGSLADIEAREKEATGIRNLRVGYNRVFGYYIEVAKGQTSMVPDTYIRKQTLANGERYITPELKELEHTILTAKDRVAELEYEIFRDLRDRITAQSERVTGTAAVIAHADTLSCLAHVAVKNNYCRPEVDHSMVLRIEAGRHPVVEQVLTDSLFVPNDTTLGEAGVQCAIITGPNMAGKSTYMRQVALITLMAQMGSFVPAKEARIGVVDKLFTRIGASDDLAGGQSTFMVEMSEVAQILRRASHRSLLILDEIGRGTSTYDGMAIARAVLEYAADLDKLGAKTLFATHYHELTALEQELAGVKNYNIAVKKRKDEMVFLRKIVPGAADRSYGVEVARMAGLPAAVLRRAETLLKQLEAGGAAPAAKAPEPEQQTDLMGVLAVQAHLSKINVETLTPIEAMNVLYKLKQMLP